MTPLLPVVPDPRGKLVAAAEACHQSWQLKVLTTNLPRGLVVPVIFGRGWSMGQVVSQDKPARSPASAAMTTGAHISACLLYTSDAADDMQ